MKFLDVLSDGVALSSSFTQESGKAGATRPSLSRPRRSRRHGCEEHSHTLARARLQIKEDVNVKVQQISRADIGSYTTTPNSFIRRRDLSPEAKGVLVELMSHRDGWNVTTRSLVGESMARGKASRILRDLEAARLLVRLQTRDAGSFGGGVVLLSWDEIEESEVRAAIDELESTCTVDPWPGFATTGFASTPDRPQRNLDYQEAQERQKPKDVLTERVVEDAISVDARAPSNVSQSVSSKRLWVDLDEKRAERAEVVAVVDAPVKAKAAMSATLPQRVEPQEAQSELAVNTKPEPEIAVVKTRPDEVAPDDHGRGEVPAAQRIEKIDAFLGAWRDEFRDGPSSARSLFVLPNAWQERLLWVWSHWTRDEIGVAFAATKKRVPDAPWSYFRACLESIARGEWGEKRAQTPNDAKRERRAKLELIAKLAPRWEIKPWLFDTVPIDDVIAYARSMPDAQNEPLSVKDLEQRIPGLAEKLPSMPQGLLSERFWRDRRFLDDDGGES